MIKMITMGPYFKYEEEEDWMTPAPGQGEVNEEGVVRVIEGVLCHAVVDVVYLDEDEYIFSRNETVSSKRVLRWVPYFVEDNDSQE